MRRNTVKIQELYVTIGRTIRDARLSEGLAGRALAERVGVTQNHLQRVESGETACALHLLVAIADELDLSLDEMVPVAIEERQTA